MSMSGLQGAPWDWHLVSCWAVLRLTFTADGIKLHGSLKSTLMDILEKLDTGRNIEGYTKDLHASPTGITAYAEGLTSMARECSLLKKCTGLRLVPTWLTISPQCFTAHTFEKYNGIVELRHIFVRLVSLIWESTPFNRCQYKKWKNSFTFRWDAALSIKKKTEEQWGRYYRDALWVEESWPAGKYFLKLKKIPSIALADLGTTAQATSRAFAVIEILVCQM